MSCAIGMCFLCNFGIALQNYIKFLMYANFFNKYTTDALTFIDMLYNAYNQYFIDVLTLFDLRIKCFLCLCLRVLCTRRVAEFGDKSHLGVYSQGDFGNSLNKELRS